MSNKRRNRRTAKSSRQTPMGRAKAQKRLNANLTEEHEWYLDTPDVRLSRIFAVVLILHVVAFGGILAFKMVDKASASTSITISSARETFEKAVEESKSLASAVPATAAGEAELDEDRARPLPPSPLRQDRNSDSQYKVQAGDSLVEIAAALKVDPAALRKANAIVSDNELYPGRWLNIPSEDDIAAVAEVARPQQAVPVSSPTTAETGRSSFYVVAKGDTAWGISRKLNVPFSELMRVNGITRPETLQIGQKLKVPAGN